MQTAIVADWLTTYAGAEKCIESFTSLYPDSDVFSLVDFLNEKERNIILKGKYAKTSFIQNLPFKEKFRNYLPLFPYAVENFDLREYDLILSSSHSVAENVLTHSEQLHICYCHTPMRYTNLPLKFQIETKTFLLPRTFNIISMTKDNLFAGKMYALLCRNWKNRVKGRDWYDFEWYVKQQIPLNMKHLQERLYESKNLDKNTPYEKIIKKYVIYDKIDTLDIAKAKKEVSVFIKNKSSLEFWQKSILCCLQIG